MGNFKVKVNTLDESKEIQNILESIGFRKFAAWSELGSVGGFIWTDSDMTYCDNRIEYFDESSREELTLAELRTMVRPMKEYLDKQEDGTYKLVTTSGGCADRDWIEIPEGAEVATASGLAVYFWKPSENKTFIDNVGWSECDAKSICTLDSYLEDGDVSIIWQRTPSLKDQYLEQAKKINDASASVFKKQDDLLAVMLNHSSVSINDQYAEIEQVRQHRHYFIDVSDVNEIDFYEIALRYNVTDPCIQHILKKCLAVGQRGQKDFHHDLKDIYDTAKRMLDVHGLDS